MFCDIFTLTSFISEPHLFDVVLGLSSLLFLHHEADELREVDAPTAVLVSLVDHLLDLLLVGVIACKHGAKMELCG